MHPIERLRYVARSGGDGPSLLVREAAGALAGFTAEPAALVTACRRLISRHPHVAPIWWVAARVLAAPDPSHEAWAATQEVEDDETPLHLIDLLPEGALVCLLGWPELSASALPPRGDVQALIVDSLGEGSGLVRRLERIGCDPVLVEERGLGAAAAEADVVLIESIGLGGDALLATAGSLAAAAVARHAGKKVWAVAGVGRVLPGRLWEAYLRRNTDDADAWDLDFDRVPLALCDGVVGPSGLQTVAQALARADCPIVPELLKSAI